MVLIQCFLTAHPPKKKEVQCQAGKEYKTSSEIMVELQECVLYDKLDFPKFPLLYNGTCIRPPYKQEASAVKARYAGPT